VLSSSRARSLAVTRLIGRGNLEYAVEVAKGDRQGVDSRLALEFERHGNRGHAPNVVLQLVGGDLKDREPSTGALRQDRRKMPRPAS
jgi:hypothetical protein